MIGGDTSSPIPNGRHYSIRIKAGEVEPGKGGPNSSFVIGWYPEFPVADCPVSLDRLVLDDRLVGG
jgi:hypothetical protein